MHRLARVAALAPALLLAPSATATGGSVSAEQAITFVQVGTGYLAISDCEAVATAAFDILELEMPDVPVTTTIGCSVNGISTTSTVHGPVAATTGGVIVAPSTVIGCKWASAVFFDAARGISYTATSPVACRDFTPI